MIGRLLRPLRSGTRKLASKDPRLASPASIDVRSPDFENGAWLPARYRGLHAIMPPLVWTNVPERAKALVLIVEDVDVPLPAPLVHAIAYDIPPTATGCSAADIPRVSVRKGATVNGVALGKSAGIAAGFLPVTPIPGHGPHRYVFQVFALDEPLAKFAHPPLKAQLLHAMSGHVIAHGKTTGLAQA